MKDSPENICNFHNKPPTVMSEMETVIYNVYEKGREKEMKAATKKIAKELIEIAETYGWEKIKVNIVLKKKK